MRLLAALIGLIVMGSAHAIHGDGSRTTCAERSRTIEESRRFRLPLPGEANAVPPGRHYLRVALLDPKRDNFPLYICLAGRDENGCYPIGRVGVRAGRPSAVTDH